jgi:hypothetical protein
MNSSPGFDRHAELRAAIEEQMISLSYSCADAHDLGLDEITEHLEIARKYLHAALNTVDGGLDPSISGAVRKAGATLNELFYQIRRLPSPIRVIED